MATATATPTPGQTPPPYLQSTSPPPNATGVPLGSPIVLTFNTAMDQNSVEQNFAISPLPYGGSFSWQGNTMTFQPALPLVPNTPYIVTLGAGTTTASAHTAATGPYTWTFTTGPVVPPA